MKVSQRKAVITLEDGDELVIRHKEALLMTWEAGILKGQNTVVIVRA